MSKKFTTKDMVLVNLLEFYPVQDMSPKPLEITQEGLAEVTGSRQNTISYAVRELVDEGSIYEETTRVKGRRQRRKGYYLTEKGTETAKRIRERLARIPVKITLNGETKSVLLKDINNYFHTNLSLLEIYCDIKDGFFKTQGSKQKRSNSAYLHHMPDPPTFEPHCMDEIIKWWEGDSKIFIIEGEGGSGKTSLITKFIDRIKGQTNIFYFKINRWHTPRYLWMSLARFLSSVGEHKLMAYLESTDRIYFKEAMSALRMDLEFIDDAVFIVEDIDAQETLMDLLCSLCGEIIDVPLVRLVVSGKPDSCPPGYRGKMRMENLSMEYGECEVPMFVEMGKAFGLDEGCDVVLDVILESKFTPEEFIALAYSSIFRTPAEKGEVMMVAEVNRNLFDTLLETPLISTTFEDHITPHDIVRERILGRLIHEEQEILHSLAAEYFDVIPAKTAEEQIEHLYHSGKAGDPEDFIVILKDHAENIISAGFNEQLIRELDSLYLNIDISGSGGYVYLWKAEAYRKSDHLDDALDAYDDIINKNMDTEILTRAHLGIASVFKSKQQYTDAIEQYKQAAKMANELGKRGESLLGAIYLQLGEAIAQTGDYKSAKDHMDKAITKLTSEKDYHLLTNSYFQLARLEKERGNTQAAIKLFEKGIDTWKKIDETYLRADGLYDIGTFYKGVRDLADAEEFLEEAVETCDRFGYTYLKALALITLTECSLERSDIEKAIRIGSEAMEIVKYLDRDEEMAYAHALLGQAYGMKDDIEEAEDHFNHAITIYHKLGLSYPLGLTYFSMAKLQEKSGNKQGVADNYRKSVLSLTSSGADEAAQHVERVMKNIPISM